MPKVIIEFTPEEKEEMVRGIFDNFPESSYCLPCTLWKYKEFRFKFYEEEESKTHEVLLPQAIEGFDLFWAKLTERHLESKTYCGLDPLSALDLCNWDAVGFDAVVQFAIFKDLIYG